MRKDILSVENITMQFGGVVAVNNLSLHIPEGQIVALIGPNGAGKTTAFNCITGVYEPTNGLVKFLDEPMVRNHPSGKMKKLYKGENPLLYTAEYHPEDETKEQMLARDPLAGTGKIVSPTPDRITKLGIARTFQNIRLWKSMTVFENVLVAKHMRAKQNVFSATFRGNAKEEKRMRDETMASAMTYEILLIVVIGGIGSVSGSCIASFLYIACSEWWLRFLDNEAYIGAFKVPLLRNGFRMVVFSVIIMIVVLFFRKGIMGERELPDLFRKRAKKAKKNVVEEGKADA